MKIASWRACQDVECAVKVRVKPRAEINMARGDGDGEPNSCHHC